MDLSQAPQWTDAEAEATLLALGPQLTWEEAHSTHWKSQYLPGPSWISWYVIVCERDTDYKPARENTWGKHDDAPKIYATLDAAKTACEYHYATGAWK